MVSTLLWRGDAQIHAKYASLERQLKHERTAAAAVASAKDAEVCGWRASSGGWVGAVNVAHPDTAPSPGVLPCRHRLRR